MNNPLLTPEGVSEKVTELYLLPTVELNAVADLIDSDIKAWLLDNFDVSTLQESYLDSLSPEYLSALGEQTARALRHRWPIEYVAHEPEVTQRSSKWIKSKEEDEAGQGGPTRGSIHTGSLTIETGY